jgi:uncharacterized membrane protein YgcG
LTQIGIKINPLTIALLVILAAAAASFLIIAIVQGVLGSPITVTQPNQSTMLEDESIWLNATIRYWNGTTVKIGPSVNIHADVSDEILRMIQEDLRGENALSNLEDETEEQEQESNDNGGGSSGGGSNGGNDDTNSSSEGGDEELNDGNIGNVSDSGGIYRCQMMVPSCGYPGPEPVPITLPEGPD